jgi:hypothetical protein
MNQKKIDELAELIYQHSPMSRDHSKHLAEVLLEEGYQKQSENTVEAVRCKDCKFNVSNMEKDPLDITDYSGDDIVCSYFLTDGLEPTDFCSRGEKMKGVDYE